MRSSGLSGSSAIITGAGSATGQAAARLFAAAGACITLIDTDEEQVHAVARSITQAGGNAMAYAADVTDPVAAARAHEAARAAFGPPLLAFNSAGTTGFGAPHHRNGPTKPADLLAATVRGLWNCMQAQLPAMLDAGRGSLVNNAAAVGPVAKPDESAHLAAQHAIVSLTRAAAFEHADRGIRINAICTGLAGTPPEHAVPEAHPDPHRQWQQAPPKEGRPGAEEVASAALWLCSDDSSPVTGHALPVEAGPLASPSGLHAP